MEYFDYQSLANQAGLTDEQLRQLVERVRHDYPQDEMLLELHVFRACRAIKDGRVTLEQALRGSVTA